MGKSPRPLQPKQTQELVDVENRAIDFGSELQSIGDPELPDAMPQTDAHDVLRMFNYNHPFMPVHLFGPSLTLVNNGANAQHTVKVPSGAKVVYFTEGNGYDWVLSFQASAVDPALATALDGGQAFGLPPGQIFKPNKMGFYVANMSSLDFWLASGARVGMLFYVQDDRG
jgi:hypothetical protein